MTLQLSIVHRLPQDYRWSAGFAGSKVEPIPQNDASSDNTLVALKLLSPDGDSAWPALHSLSHALTDISADSSVPACVGEDRKTVGEGQRVELGGRRLI